MLQPAYLHKENLSKVWAEIALDDRSLYATHDVFVHFDQKIDDSNWAAIQFVSVAGGKILGYFNAGVNRSAEKIDEILVFSVPDKLETEMLMFMTDYVRFFDMLFTKYGFKKIEFSCIVGSPAEKFNDRLLKYNKGRVVGTFKSAVKLRDGHIYDKKWYEVFNPNL